MSQIRNLISRLCPHGVEFKALGEIAELVRGNGLPKSVFSKSGIGCIHYGQIYTYYGIWADKTISFVALLLLHRSRCGSGGFRKPAHAAHRRCHPRADARGQALGLFVPLRRQRGSALDNVLF